MTDLRDLQRKIENVRSERGFVTDPLKIQILLTEEIGEISAELKRFWSKNYDGFDSKRLADEISDALVLLSALASEFEIDLEDAIESKFFQKDEAREWKTRK